MLDFRKTLALVLLLLTTGCAKERVYNVPMQEVESNFAQREEVFVAPVMRSGLRACANDNRCTADALLPPQPCEQPMPTYYDDASELMLAEGAVLMHPITRVKVLCLNQPGMDVFSCVETFRSDGYVLVTDVPQFAGRYDLLQEGIYPTRRWRRGESVPRW